MSKHVPWLVQVAEAAVTWEDLVNGVVGKDQVTGLDAIHKTQIAIMRGKWDRCEDLEYGFTHKIDYRVYSKMFDHGRRWLTLTAAAHGALGVWCDVECRPRPPT